MTRKSFATGGLKKVLMTVAVVGVGGSLAGLGAYSAFTATTTNAGNSISSGTVAISDTDGGSTALYSATGQVPGDSTVSCIRVTYGGSVTASAVKLYSGSISNGANYNLKVERGSGISSPGSDMNCTGFSASSTAFDAALSTFPTTYAGGIDGKASGATWANTNSVDYRFTITVVDDSTPNAHTSANATGAHTFTWEARS